jgi:prepilin-type N-terminal cleavage/methylation domain-containing protein
MKDRERPAGFTLLEVLIAIFLFALTAVGLASALSHGLSGLRDSRDLILVQAALQEEMANLRATDPASLQPKEREPFLSRNDLSESLGGHGELTIRPQPDSNLIEVTAEVVWIDWASHESRIALSTILWKGAGDAAAPSQ